MSDPKSECTLAPRRVLIVDDASEVRRELTVLLELTGQFEIVGDAANGLEAISQTAALNPEVVLMDLEMPTLDGYEAARRIKASSPTCHVIALTVHDGEAERQRASSAGIDGFIVKGAVLETLIRVISGTE